MRLKISAAVIATGCCILLGVVAGMYPYEKERQQEYLQNIHTLLSAVFDQKNEQLANEIYSHQTEALDFSLKELRAVKEVSHVLIYNLDGELSAFSSDDSIPIPPNVARLPTPPFDTIPDFQQTQYQRIRFAEFFSPIEVIGVHVGYIRVLYDLSRFYKESRMVFLYFGALFLLLVLVIILLNFFLTRSVITPAFRLKDAMKQLQEGNLDVRLAVNAKDEIGQMGSAFNEMARMLKNQHAALTDAMETKDAFARKLANSNDELEALNENLEHMVKERTRALSESNRQLQAEMQERQLTYRKKKELEQRLARSKKMEALGLLAGGVAHDLNNVLSGIVSYPDLLLMDVEPAHPMYGPIVTIKKSGQKAAAIVQDLLTLARRGVVVNEVLNLNDVLSDYLMSPEHHKIEMFHADILIETRMEDDLCNIKGSSLHLKKSVMNLVSNAAEAQPDGGSIRIATYNRHVDTPIPGYEELGTGDYVVLEVRDFGIGISKTDQERIFEPFYTKKSMGRSGTGLGMAVVWGTIQDHKGYIHIKSEVDRGTCFELFFPATRKLPTRLIQQNAPVIDACMGGQQRVMIIDDVPEQIEIATVILKKLGYYPLSASSGEEAVTYLRSNTADILLLDMIMDPGIDGLDTYKKIIEIHPGQKAIVVSGFAENSRVKEVQALGAGSYLKKPYTIEKLGHALKAVLEN